MLQDTSHLSIIRKCVLGECWVTRISQKLSGTCGKTRRCSPREEGEKSDRDLANLGQFQVASESWLFGKALNGRGEQRGAEMVVKEEAGSPFKKI